MKNIIILGCVLLVALFALVMVVGVPPAVGKSLRNSSGSDSMDIGSTFTYQGQLKQNNIPVNESCQMDFRLYNAASGDIQVGDAITKTIPITSTATSNG